MGGDDGDDHGDIRTGMRILFSPQALGASALPGCLLVRRLHLADN